MSLSSGPPPPSQGERRFHCALPVTLRRRGEDLHLLTSDVTFKDAFIRSTAPPPLNSLVRLVFALPPDDTKLALSAHVTDVVPAEGSAERYPGFAVRFVALDGAAKDLWEGLVWRLKRDHREAAATTVMFARPSYVARFQLGAPVADDIRLAPGSVEELARIINEEIPTGTLVIPTAAPTVLGANVRVEIVHPITDDVVPLEGVIRRRGAGAQAVVMVGLAKISMDLRIALQELLDSVVVLDEYDVELYEDAAVTA